MNVDLWGRAKRRAAKARRATQSMLETPWLAIRATHSDRPLVDHSNSIVVSLTSYGSRLATVHLTIESIGRGHARPQRIILWTDPGISLDSLPLTLQRLRGRGLEIQESPARLGPHTKYYPYVASVANHEVPLVTADDDSIYPRGWLSRLQSVSAEHPTDIICYRAHRVSFGPDGAFAPYNAWGQTRDAQSSPLNFATGVSGVHYPAVFLNQLRDAGLGFLSCCPNADDIWLHFQAVDGGYAIRQVGDLPRKYPELASTQQQALHRTNTGASANDSQIVATYSATCIAALQREAASE